MTTRIDAETEQTLDTEHDPSAMPFFPDFAIREAATAFVYLSALLVVASLTRAPIEDIADPSATGVHPVPEWYFLWLFYLLQFFKGKFQVVGTFLLPVIGIGALMALPFLDRLRPRMVSLLPGTRPVRFAPRVFAALAIIGIGALTFLALKMETPAPDTGPHLTQSQAAGQALFGKMGCPTCHRIGAVGGTRGPALTAFALKPDARNRVLLHFSGFGSTAGSSMPSYLLTKEEERSLADYLLSLGEVHSAAHP